MKLGVEFRIKCILFRKIDHFLAKIDQTELKPNQIHHIRPDLPGNDAIKAVDGHLLGSGSLELATFHQHSVTSIELADK